jgi:hypothetical protein
MAKRRKTTRRRTGRHHSRAGVGKRVHRRRTHRRKVGAKGDLMAFVTRVVGVAAGAVGGAYLIPAMTTFSPFQTLPAWAVPSMVAAAGAALPYIAPGTPILEDIGMGLLAIGIVETANQTFLNVPGISGMAMRSNIPPGTPALTRAIGCNKMGAGPNAYMSKVVGAKKGNRLMSIGKLVAD